MASTAKDKEKSSLCFFSSSSISSFYREIKPSSLLPRIRFVVFVLLCYVLWLRLLFFSFPLDSSSPASYSSAAAGHRHHQVSRSPETCDPDIAPFYIHTIHPRFNAALVRRCLSRLACCDVCPHVGHLGLGRPLLRLPDAADAADAVRGTAWYATHPSTAEMLFHARVQRHPCRTMVPEAAVLFYVPFYAGLHAAANFRQANHTRRDALAVDLATHLSSLPSFRRRAGRDHFLAVGRASWDFMRSPAGPDLGANRLLLLPEVANMTVLTVERHPWEGHNQFGIPYPSYFHPRTAADVAEWQAELRRLGRTHLFAFVGGVGSDSENADTRSSILNQCRMSDRCLAVECKPDRHKCDDPDLIMDVMRRADFCLQPPGESFTRRSTFDSVLAGCIPVFFSEHTAHTQYRWYLPSRPGDWSVMLEQSQRNQIEDELARIPRAEVGRMREVVIGLIPRMTYAHPDANRSQLGFRDAVDVALVELTRRVRSIRNIETNDR
ncbi:probable xyloglucan galactosyltransferase GT17 [Musa acuminata AAA Group]|uniref:probable xyloglucan galactosyltransferase GT17 n=1 Tax=Musa acuminata AAA Group TaxID=214697 RepID=UPI0031D42574